ncbi:MAG: aminotransferase class III-fold pyridoxal phosphate-dependent enzyme [Rhodospirillaceae bacterium]|nr:MAG: aminotransferase class III-fold pyridoxal phosphate-dependent enzyme [Rhodospirillaceae bacterium]
MSPPDSKSGPPPKSTAKGQALYAKARALIPGGTQLLSKRPEMFLPGGWPAYYNKAKGAEITDLDGNTYIDMSIGGVGATVLGYADPDVDGAVKAAIDAGSMTTLNCPEEVRLAELLVALHPWSRMVRFSRSGGEAMSIAVRIARAHTGRQVIAFCGYHGWHDWYLSANLADDSTLDGHLLAGLAPKGVPRGLQGLMQPFHYNDLAGLKRIAQEHGANLAAIVMEPVRNPPAPGFLEGVRQVADECGAVLVFDEITAGFRVNTGGIHLTLGVDPDMAVFAKAMGNGYPISAVLGREAVMAAAQETFISSTAWTERTGPAAALATITKYRARNVSAHLVRVGERVMAGWRRAAATADLPIEVSGIAPLAHFAFQVPDAVAARTLFTQLMLDRGYLAKDAFYAMYAHTDAQVDGFIAACEDAFVRIAVAVRANRVRDALRGDVAHSGFQRLT